MKWLDAILPAPAEAESRYSMNDWIADFMVFGGNRYGFGPQTTYGSEKADPIADEFGGFIDGALKSNGVVSAIEQVRFSVFAEARFLFQQLRGGRPGDLFGTPELSILERPWPGGTTGDLLSRMLLHADLSGNAYAIRVRDEIVLLRPDWVEILLGERVNAGGDVVGFTRLGYFYYHGGKHLNREPIRLLASEVAHFAPYPDPAATFRGMSWMTPVIREIQGDKAATSHKLKFYENAATPNLAVKWPDTPTREEFERRMEMANQRYAGTDNAYKTMFLAGGADVTPLGSNMQQMDFKSVQGAGETRLAAAAGVHPVIVGLSEGMQGSSLNAGNYAAAKRRFSDATMRPLWRNAAGTLEVLVPPPTGARLWYDDRDVAFLREDVQDRANVQSTHASTIRQLVDSGYTPESAVLAVTNEDMTLLVHSGLMSVQLLPPGTTGDSAEPDADEVGRSVPLIADGAIRVEMHPPSVEVDARTMIEAGEVSPQFSFPDSIVESLSRQVDDASDRLESVVDAAVGRLVERDEVTEGLSAAIRGLEERVAEPKPLIRKRVDTDEIGRITNITEEYI